MALCCCQTRTGQCCRSLSLVAAVIRQSPIRVHNSEGTAFFPLQSCMDHSCCPNVKALKRDEDNDGHGVIIALEPISKDDEITISYIDEDLPYEERQAQLADYRFTCTCCRCQEEKPN